jgi:hypothetical protein
MGYRICPATLLRSPIVLGSCSPLKGEDGKVYAELQA